MLKITLNSPVPIYEQLITGIKEKIVSGELSVGESLPSIRILAKTLDVAANTVARAYNELERLGYVESFGAKGTYVKETVIPEGELIPEISDLLISLGRQGYNKEQIRQIIDLHLKKLNN